MKSGAAAMAILGLAASPAAATEANPIEKVLEMISGLQAKVIAEGQDAQKAYDEHAEWCSDRSKNLDFEIKTGKTSVEELKAVISEETSSAAASSTKIEELSADIQTNEADLASATSIRDQEAADLLLRRRSSPPSSRCWSVPYPS